MDPIDVIVRHARDGKIYPLQFTRAGSVHKVRDVGRRWVDDDAGEHILVMVEGGQVVELLYDAEGRWYHKPRPGAEYA